ncbi:hypothetical protein Cni_G03099 [Canna indica]|uniref:Uncharacterized protein n=1 Tax=Canna indica TaxID=4628 RepID=A0AAQ3JSM2_9LILI|nr:hypothetical protein Cni_G03099 [Canna indica]
MEVRCLQPNTAFPRGQQKKIMMTPSLICCKQTSLKTSVSLSKTFMINKIYEDQVMGIVCYRDARGEIICEGCDEGPRHSHPSSSSNERPKYTYWSPGWLTGIVCEGYDEDLGVLQKQRRRINL